MKLGNLHIYRRLGWVGNFGLALFTLTFIVGLSGCTTAWVSEANAIIAEIVPAISAVMGLLAAFGLKISADDLTRINTAAAEVRTDLNEVIKPLIDQYNEASTTAQPGILNQIQAALDTVVANWKGVFSALHIKDVETQGKVQAVATAIADEIASLLTLIPALQAAVAGGDHAFMAAMKGKRLPMSAGNFKTHFNHVLTSKTGDPEIDSVTPQYKLS